MEKDNNLPKKKRLEQKNSSFSTLRCFKPQDIAGPEEIINSWNHEEIHDETETPEVSRISGFSMYDTVTQRRKLQNTTGTNPTTVAVTSDTHQISLKFKVQNCMRIDRSCHEGTRWVKSIDIKFCMYSIMILGLYDILRVLVPSKSMNVLLNESLYVWICCSLVHLICLLYIFCSLFVVFPWVYTMFSWFHSLVRSIFVGNSSAWFGLSTYLFARDTSHWWNKRVKIIVSFGLNLVIAVIMLWGASGQLQTDPFRHANGGLRSVWKVPLMSW